MFFGCDPFKANKLNNRNQLGTYWIYSILSETIPSFTGILFASIMCHSIAHYSMGVSLCSNLFYGEIINHMFLHRFNLKEEIISKLKMILTIVVGSLSILLSIGLQYVKNTALSLFFIFNNSTNSPILGLYFLSAFNPYANHVKILFRFEIVPFLL
jgi:Na+/proline symporter